MRKAAILAAGDSTRMLPLSANMPKHLLPVAGEPLIFHTLRGLMNAGIKETLIVYGYRGEALREGIDSQDWGKMIVLAILIVASALILIGLPSVLNLFNV